MKTDGELVSDYLIQLMNQQNLTINLVAVLSGLNQSTVNAMFEVKSKRPTITTIRKVCKL